MSGWVEGGEEKRVWTRSVSFERTYCRIGGRLPVCFVSGLDRGWWVEEVDGWGDFSSLPLPPGTFVDLDLDLDGRRGRAWGWSREEGARGRGRGRGRARLRDGPEAFEPASKSESSPETEMEAESD